MAIRKAIMKTLFAACSWSMTSLKIVTGLPWGKKSKFNHLCGLFTLLLSALRSAFTYASYDLVSYVQVCVYTCYNYSVIKKVP